MRRVKRSPESSPSTSTSNDGQSSFESYETFSSRLKENQRKVAAQAQDNKFSKMSKSVLFFILVIAIIFIGVCGPVIMNAVMTGFKFPNVNEDAASRLTKTRVTPPKSKVEKKKDWRTEFNDSPPLTMFTDTDLKYAKGGKLLLVIAGHVFDVSIGEKMYGEEGGYHGFIGKDGTRAFVTGKFDDDGLTPDLTGLSSDDLKGVSSWINFYFNHEQYKFVGVHVGTFFDKNGRETITMKEFRDKVAEAEVQKSIEMETEQEFPACNMEWSAGSGSRLWCSKQSGGVERDWVGFPRVFDDDGKPSRCACVHPNNLADPRVKTYKGCPISAPECKIKE